MMCGDFASGLKREILRLGTRCCIGWVGENPGGMILVPPTPDDKIRSFIPLLGNRKRYIKYELSYV